MSEFPHTTGADSAPRGFDPLDPPPAAGAGPHERARRYPGFDPPPRRSSFDLSPLFLLLDGLRRALPRELEQQFTTLLRELLLTLRSLIDWYLDRLDGRRREPQVEDIPID
jgi:hypothetical protein